MANNHVTGIPRQEFLALRVEVLERDGHQCRLCGKPTNEVDHVWPVILGGRTTLDNLQAICRPCNAQKAGRPVGLPAVAESTCRHCRLGEAVPGQLCRPCAQYEYRSGQLPPEKILDRRLERFVAATNQGRALPNASRRNA